jgi:uncharacterized membrane-anchored protein YhcB (DUF1043 family)
VIARAWPAVAVMVLCLAWGALGFAIGKWHGDTRVAAVETRVAKEAQAGAEQALAEARAERDRSHTAVANAQTRAEIAETLARSYRDAIEHLTDGRDCLGPDARRVLHQHPAFAVSPTTGSTARAAAAPAAAAGERYSTDTDLGGWVADAAAYYERCRARVDAMREWADAPN